MRCTARNRAADISASNTRRLTAKPSAMMRSSSMWRPGNSRAPTASRVCTRRRWCTKRSSWPPGATSDPSSLALRRAGETAALLEVQMNLTLHVWRQKGGSAEGAFVEYDAANISSDASCLEMLDVVNEQLIE